MAAKSEIVAVLQERTGAFLALLRALTGESDRPSIAHALAWSVRRLGGSTASLLEPTEDEVATIASGDALIDVAELRLLESMRGNLIAVTNRTGPVQDDYNDLSRRLEKAITEKRAAILGDHGIDLQATAAQTARIRAL